MEDIVLINAISDYGAFELKKVYKKNFAFGLTIAVLFHLFLVGAYFFIQSVLKENEDNIATVRILKYSDLGPPPSLNQNTQQQLAVTAPAIKPSVAVPVPVPDKEAPKEQTIATQQEMSQVAAPVSEGNGSGNVQITKDLQVDQDTDPGINSFVPVEKQPEIVKSAQPDYPEIAKRAGMEGTVYVKILVDKEGKPKRAVVIKSDAEMFNQPSIDAAMKFLFTPAIQDKKPVEIWVVIPFKFRLQ
jgi:periplasmic protein TonB